jgi:hypothetical protein
MYSYIMAHFAAPLEICAWIAMGLSAIWLIGVAIRDLIIRKLTKSKRQARI